MNEFQKFLMLSACLIVFGCGHKATRTPASPVDTPEMHYDRGRELLKEQQPELAKNEFDHALSLDKNFAPAYEGLARVALTKGQIELSYEMARKSLQVSPNWPLSRLVLARLYTIDGRFDRAETAVRNAQKLIKNSETIDKDAAYSEALLVLGDIYRHAGKYADAQEAFREVLELDPLNIPAGQEIEELALYQIVVAGQRREYTEIASVARITRADIATLIATEMSPGFTDAQDPDDEWPPLVSMFQYQSQDKSGHVIWWPLDVDSSHWAGTSILEALQSGVMENFPDRHFRPNETINRAEFAVILHRLSALQQRENSQSGGFFGLPSPFNDVNSNSPVFPSIMLVTTRNLLSGESDGTFRPLAGVSGSEALGALRKLKSQLP